MRKIMTTSTAILSIILVAFFISTDNTNESQTAFAAEKTQIENKPISESSNGITLDFTVPSTVYATKITPIKIDVKDSDSGAPISHVDWAISVKDPDGNIVHRTTTAHSHAGKMNFDVTFPGAGDHVVSLTANSIGPKMMGMDVPPKAYTHTMLSGSLAGF